MRAPAAGWYSDPSAAAAYRWWNGRHWTSATLPRSASTAAGSPPVAQDPPARPTSAQQPLKPSSDVGSASPEAAPSPSVDPGVTPDSFPTRRSLRAQSTRDADPAEGPALTDQRPSLAAGQRPESPEPTPPLPTPAPLVQTTRAEVRAETAVTPAPPKAAAADLPRNEPVILPPFAAARAAALSPAPQPLERPATTAPPTVYRPVNPLTGPAAREVPVSPPGFTVPAAWVANAPAVAPTPGYAVRPGQIGPAASARPGSYGSVRPQPVNRAARLSLTFPLLVIAGGMVFGIISGILVATGIVRLDRLGVLVVVAALFGLVAVGLVIAGIPLAIVGLVRATEFRRAGFTAKGRPHAIIGLILCAVMLANGVHSGIVGADAQRHRTTGVTSSAQRAAPAAATTPQVGVAQEDGTYSYSQAQAQDSIGAAYTTTLKRAPASVTCPGSEPLQISVSFSCTVTLAGGAVTTAHVTIIDDEGHAEVQVE